MSGKSFFDTNVLGYSLDDRDPVKTNTALRLLSEATDRRSSVISYQVVQEILNIAFGRFRPPMSSAYAVIYVERLFEDFEVVLWSPLIVRKAMLLRERYKFAWYDCLIVAAALEAECDVLYTEDLQHQQRIEGLTVVNPFL
jgi:predicted nucleic acid-binding protein